MARAKHKSAYHHGDLAPELRAVAAKLIEEQGLNALSLREVARLAGVSHAAPAHHFGDKAGLFTALATEGFTWLSAAIEESFARVAGSDDKARFLAAGVAYVRFAVEHPAHFRVMWSPVLLHARDASYQTARAKALELLVRAVVRSHPEALKGGHSAQEIALAAWSAAHGMATLYIDHNLDPFAPKGGVTKLAERVLGILNDAIAQRVTIQG